MSKRFFSATIAGTFMFAGLAYGQMDLNKYKELAGTNEKRCNDAIANDECKDLLNVAKEKNLITAEAYDWGMKNDYYPAINLRGKISAICKCGCFDENTLVLVEDGGERLYKYQKIKNLTRDSKVLALASEASLSDLKTMSAGISSVTKGPEKNDLYVFHYGDANLLKVTQHHGMVLSDGKVIAAKDVKIGDSFISASTGKAVTVKNITRENPKADVRNFQVDAADNINHIVVANDVLVGDIRWQNGLASELGSIQLRK